MAKDRPAAMIVGRAVRGGDQSTTGAIVRGRAPRIGSWLPRGSPV